MAKPKTNQIEQDINLAKKIHAGVLLDVPFIIWGTPGGGKTHSIYDVCKKLELDCYPLVANTYEPPYFGGYPVVNGDEVVTAKPDFIKDLEKFTKPVVVFLDELPTTPRATQNVLLRIIHERKIGQWTLNPFVRIAAAGNFVDVAGNTLLSPALANRFFHIFHKPKIDEWLASLSNNVQVDFNYEENWKKDIKYFENVVVDFAETYYKSNPEFFSSLPTEFLEAEDYPFATPRTLTQSARILALCYLTDFELCKELLRGSIGKMASVKLLAHIAAKDKLEKFTEIDLNGYKFSKDPSQVTVLLRSAAMYADEYKYCEKAIQLFKLAYENGYQSVVMKYCPTLAKNLQQSSHSLYDKAGGAKNAKNLIDALPFYTEILTAEMKK